MKKIEKCTNCSDKTYNYYTIKTNRGDLHQCRDCYERLFMRSHRNDYALNSTKNKKDRYGA